MSMYLQRNHMISIHVPAKGTTQQVVEVIGQILISIHVPAKGTTSLFRRLHPILIISIHVPAKGTTLTPLKNAFSNQNFNPRSREGNDSKTAYFPFLLCNIFIYFIQIKC